MSWLWPRLLTALLALLGASLLGGLVGYVASGTPWRAALAGAALVSLALVVRDAWRAHRLMQWLRGTQEGPAPRGRRFWGEVGYRVERALRLRERALEQERERLAQFLSAIEASPNGVMLLDSRDQIEWCNSVAADHLGLDPVRDLRQRVTNLVRAPAFVAHLQGGQFGEPLVIPSPRGDASLSIGVRPYGDGLKLVLTQDITERERNDAMRRDFVANVSHEIRTPLTVLAGFVETMASLPLTEAERQRVLVLMQQQTDRMQSLVADLLTLAQLEGSPRPPPDHWVPLASLLQRVQADALSLSAGRHQLEFHQEEEALVELAGNESELFSAIANLVNNAVRYTPAGGRVETVWRARAGGGGELEVRDNGIGIAKEHLPRLTERFYRVDGSRSRDTGGTGLGLSIVKHVAQRHGGELDVRSELGKGSSFRLVLPPARVRREPQVAALATG
ncbi:phosphate regulon sensor histidine kinase PhoR [Ideonella sp. BN130291]|uniref:phosphate regulon sensor histidine kinase PhoR n=1 Tax=Ideonella sp. BN130291 TaxID=3112940 RepID=UPI002E2605A2|nr:phosphate regulon sensor histidine kinase PhoR [Ideonella sp. BN130291]